MTICAPHEPLFDDMIKSVYWFVVFFETFCRAPLASAQRSCELLGERLVLTKFTQDRFMQKIGDVFGIVE